MASFQTTASLIIYQRSVCIRQNNLLTHPVMSDLVRESVTVFKWRLSPLQNKMLQRKKSFQQTTLTNYLEEVSMEKNMLQTEFPSQILQYFCNRNKEHIAQTNKRS